MRHERLIVTCRKHLLIRPLQALARLLGRVARWLRDARHRREWRRRLYRMRGFSDAVREAIRRDKGGDSVCVRVYLRLPNSGHLRPFSRHRWHGLATLRETMFGWHSVGAGSLALEFALADDCAGCGGTGADTRYGARHYDEAEPYGRCRACGGDGWRTEPGSRFAWIESAHVMPEWEAAGFPDEDAFNKAQAAALAGIVFGGVLLVVFVVWLCWAFATKVWQN